MPGRINRRDAFKLALVGGQSPHQFVLRQGRACEGDVSHSRSAGPSGHRGLRLQVTAALCASVRSGVRISPSEYRQAFLALAGRLDDKQ
jgi:hypothetical protein